MWERKCEKSFHRGSQVLLRACILTLFYSFVWTTQIRTRKTVFKCCAKLFKSVEKKKKENNKSKMCSKYNSSVYHIYEPSVLSTKRVFFQTVLILQILFISSPCYATVSVEKHKSTELLSSFGYTKKKTILRLFNKQCLYNIFIFLRNHSQSTIQTSMCGTLGVPSNQTREKVCWKKKLLSFHCRYVVPTRSLDFFCKWSSLNEA